MVKRFLEWIGLKEELDSSEYRLPSFNAGELWWCYIGENIGVEASGKGDQFTRPVLILKKYNRHSFFAIPLTTKDKIGTWYYSFSHNNKFENAHLAQGRVASSKRLKHRIGRVDSNVHQKIGAAFIAFHKT